MTPPAACVAAHGNSRSYRQKSTSTKAVPITHPGAVHTRSATVPGCFPHLLMNPDARHGFWRRMCTAPGCVIGTALRGGGWTLLSMTGCFRMRWRRSGRLLVRLVCGRLRFPHALGRQARSSMRHICAKIHSCLQHILPSFGIWTAFAGTAKVRAWGMSLQFWPFGCTDRAGRACRLCRSAWVCDGVPTCA